MKCRGYFAGQRLAGPAISRDLPHQREGDHTCGRNGIFAVQGRPFPVFALGLHPFDHGDLHPRLRQELKIALGARGIIAGEDAQDEHKRRKGRREDERSCAA